jgi:formylmethanofuran dehydrogenase subunit E
MLEEKCTKICAVGTFQQNLMIIDDVTLAWIDAAEFNTATLAKLIGIDEEHKVRAKITLEVVEEKCESCGRLTSGHNLCERCGKLICDECAESDATGRYCPLCHDLERRLTGE